MEAIRLRHPSCVRKPDQVFSVAHLLYREVRSGAIHEHGFGVDEERFFTEEGPYVDTMVQDYGDNRHLGLYVPGSWLIDLLRTSLENYKVRLLTTRRLPGDLFAEICAIPDELDYLDEESVPDERVFGPNVPR